MTNEEAKKIIKNEGLQRFNWYNEHPLKENEVTIRIGNSNHWEVLVTDERASVVGGSITAFDNESDALDNFIKRLRTEKILYQ
ncbi:Imm59 family immunity protein [Bacillus sp. X1(2014)]|uniref:Imm59 family immunity protein n=1 Tax=Bacillus sp. X1(2014) TaxID=1565991 RepID=UPI00119CFCB4|nr:Imm59 family immunity protein [Bacillus sp. X1(2014)]